MRSSDWSSDVCSSDLESAMRAVIATSTLNDAIGPGQSRITQRVQELMQQILDSYGSGLQVQGVALRRVDPPAAVIDEFKAVSSSEERRVWRECVSTCRLRGYADPSKKKPNNHK